MKGNYRLKIIDVHQQKTTAEIELIALPMLIKLFPLPHKRLIGGLSDTGKIIHELGNGII
jgi:circadian clock protein KaiB